MKSYTEFEELPEHDKVLAIAYKRARDMMTAIEINEAKRERARQESILAGKEAAKKR